MDVFEVLQKSMYVQTNKFDGDDIYTYSVLQAMEY